MKKMITRTGYSILITVILDPKMSIHPDVVKGCKNIFSVANPAKDSGRR